MVLAQILQRLWTSGEMQTLTASSKLLVVLSWTRAGAVSTQRPRGCAAAGSLCFSLLS